MENVGARVIVEASSLTYFYPGASRAAVEGLDFHIHEGEIFGFLGPNGSGKSTTQKVLTRILRQYHGEVFVFGKPLASSDADYFNHVGVSFEFPNLYEKLTAEENLEFYRSFFDGETEIPGALLEELDLPRGDRRPVSQYSKGMRMRVVLARSLVNRPRLWFLDEPTTGQDPQHAVAIRRLIRKRANEGSTVFLTTHDMVVADELCDRVALLVDGRIQVIDTPRSLRLAHSERFVRVEVANASTGPRIRDFNLEKEEERTAFIELIRTTRVETIHTLEPSLEQVFLKLTGRRLE